MAAKFKKGDLVYVTNGKNKSQKGKILKIKDDMVTISNVNIRNKKLAKPTEEGAKFIKIEAPINVSNIMHVDPKTGVPTKIGFKFIEKNEKIVKVRYSKKSLEIIPEPEHYVRQSNVKELV